MTELFFFLFLLSAFAGACVVAYGMTVFIQRARRQNKSLAGGAGGAEEEEEFINIALCVTQHGIRTHYHNIGVKPLNYISYPDSTYLTGAKRTLCGADVGWDVQNQEAQATCLVCGVVVRRMAKASTNES
ncbi:hypothetical protein LCGC14_1135870 [marine sediment metagenome]|uniref:Uncharacterized protein n=1 Tax=marine sediment metagenome TaxID=412755 RepID=A0A0F9MMN2_9ZZZZ